MQKEQWQKLPMCHKEAEKLDIIFTCDGAASVGQVGHEVAVKITKERAEEARMCCLSAIAAGSKPHIEIARKAKRLIAINGCGNKCTSKILQGLGITPSFEYTMVDMAVEKVPTLDFDSHDVHRIAKDLMQKMYS